MTSENEFIAAPQYSENDAPEVVFIFGNGIVDNGWHPYRQHLINAKGIREDIFNLKHNDVDLSIFLARHAFNIRLAQEHVKKKIFEYIHNPHKNPNGVEGVEAEAERLQNLFRVTQQIGEYYSTLESQLVRLRGQNGEVLSLCRDFSKGKSFGVITTNWDLLLLNDEFWGRNIIQLHGRADKNGSIILPTQFAIDSLNDWGFVEDIKKRGIPKYSGDWVYSNNQFSEMNLIELLELCFRPEKLSKDLFSAHVLAQSWLKNAKEIVAAGIAFNSYDSELLSILPLKEVDDSVALRKLTIYTKEREGFCGSGNRAKSSFGIKVAELVEVEVICIK